MSNRLKIAIAVEGSTDFIILEEVITKLLQGRDFVARYVQPEMSASFQPIAGQHGFGWPGLCRWCLDAAQQAGGRVSKNVLFRLNEMLVVQVDADVAGSSYSAGHVENPSLDATTLPCEEPCPPSSATTDRLRSTVLHWLGEASTPPRTVLCTPSKALETWLLVALFPEDTVVRRSHDIECRANPDRRLQGKPKARRLVSGGRKQVDKYKELAPEFAERWDSVTTRCSEAERFEADFRRTLTSINNRLGTSP